MRFYRYLDRPGREKHARIRALSPEERQALSWREARKSGFYLLFAKLGPPIKPDDLGDRLPESSDGLDASEGSHDFPR
jgi:hypothetical protein